jgi:cyclopropane fatty-acyl-phospholipid synthase-like methyltransferase
MDYRKESEMFNQMVDYYDKYRPDYPEDIINRIISEANLTVGSKLLEIGSGSGKATYQFADYGFEIFCVDPGADLIQRAAKRFQGKNISFAVSRFEDYAAPPEYFDTIISAQAFHWIPKPEGFGMCAATLKSGGYLFPFWNIEIIYDSDLDKELLATIDKHKAYTSTQSKADHRKRMETISSEIADSGFFTKPEIVLSHWEKTYTADDYFGFALTGNIFVQQSDETKQAFYNDLKDLEAKYNGIKRHYTCELYIAKKL